MTKLTFVFGRTYMHARNWIEHEYELGHLGINQARNITNPQSLRGLKSTETTQIEFVWLSGCQSANTHNAMVDMMRDRQAAGANIKEYRGTLVDSNPPNVGGAYLRGRKVE